MFGTKLLVQPQSHNSIIAVIPVDAGRSTFDIRLQISATVCAIQLNPSQLVFVEDMLYERYIYTFWMFYNLLRGNKTKKQTVA